MLMAAVASLVHSASAVPQTLPPLPERAIFYITPTIEGLYTCDEGLSNPKLKDVSAVNDYCTERGLDGSPGLIRLLNELEPGGPRGQVQVGYLATLQLLSLYRKIGQAWEIDDKKLDIYFQILSKVQRPVVVYLAANHFDTQSPLAAELSSDKNNLLLLSDGQPAQSNYFGYPVVPYTLRTDENITVNRLRYAALKHVAKRLTALPNHVRERIIAVSLAGEIHHMFPDFESGGGKYQDIKVTDYSVASITEFRRWLKTRYGSLEKFNSINNFSYPSFEKVPAPSKNIRKDKLLSFGEHYDAYADGKLPIAGWLWDPMNRVSRLELHIDSTPVGNIDRNLNRQDVYRAVKDVLTPNVGYRRDFDYSSMTPGTHAAQVIAVTTNASYLVGQVKFVIGDRDQGPVRLSKAIALTSLPSIKQLTDVKAWLDLPNTPETLYFNPLARDWNQYRGGQVKSFMANFFEIAVNAGIPKQKIYSHQIVTRVNSSWNPQLFAVDDSFSPSASWKHGINMYGGATNSDWMRAFIAENQIVDYGAPEFNPQQWKVPGTHLSALKSHYLGGARFISPYYFSTVPDRYKAAVRGAVNAMELRPDNPSEGSNQFYQAIREFGSW